MNPDFERFQNFAVELAEDLTPSCFHNDEEMRSLAFMKNLEGVYGVLQTSNESKSSTQLTRFMSIQTKLLKRNIYQQRQQEATFSPETFISHSGNMEIPPNGMQSYYFYHNRSQEGSANSERIATRSAQLEMPVNQMPSYSAYCKEPQETLFSAERFSTHSDYTEIPAIQMPSFSTRQNLSQEPSVFQNNFEVHTEGAKIPASELPPWELSEICSEQNTYGSVREIPTRIAGRDPNQLNAVPDMLKDFRDQMLRGFSSSRICTDVANVNIY